MSLPSARSANPRKIEIRRAAQAASTGLASLLLALVLWSCGKSGAGGGARGGMPQMPPMPVEVAEARKQPVREGFQALGTIEAVDNVLVVSEIAGVVTSLPFREGQSVGRGAVLARIEGSEIAAQARRSAAMLDQEKANLARAEKLFERKLISEEEMDRVRTGERVAEANLSLDRARLAKTSIRAPWSGAVGTRRVSPGAYVKPGDVLTDLAKLDEMKLTFDAPERYAQSLRQGAHVLLTTPAFPTEMFSGRITVVEPQVDPQTRTIRVSARIPNPGRKLKPGMSASVQATTHERPAALVIPSEAVFVQGSESFVYVVNADSTVQQAAVQLGTRDSSNVEIVQGLQPGNLVVRAGHQKLFPGAKVMPVFSDGSGKPVSAAPGAAPGLTASTSTGKSRR